MKKKDKQLVKLNSINKELNNQKKRNQGFQRNLMK